MKTSELIILAGAALLFLPKLVGAKGNASGVELLPNPPSVAPTIPQQKDAYWSGEYDTIKPGLNGIIDVVGEIGGQPAGHYIKDGLGYSGVIPEEFYSYGGGVGSTSTEGITPTMKDKLEKLNADLVESFLKMKESTSGGGGGGGFGSSSSSVDGGAGGFKGNPSYSSSNFKTGDLHGGFTAPETSTKYSTVRGSKTTVKTGTIQNKIKVSVSDQYY